MVAEDDPTLSPHAARRLVRTGRHTGQTAGLAQGYLQGNVVILPSSYALAFATYCHRNPKPCPVIAIGDPGDPGLPTLGEGIDIRTDVPKFNVYRHGELTEQTGNLERLWQSDFVTFVLGCSFSFEAALLEAGIRVRHIEEGRTVPMYRTSKPTLPAGPFAGPLVVSLRMLAPAAAVRAVQITSRFASSHGAPVHLGDPASIGIPDLAKPDWGDPPIGESGDIPVFWACGVTPQAAIERAKPEIAITHHPGAMLITDIEADSYDAI